MYSTETIRKLNEGATESFAAKTKSTALSWDDNNNTTVDQEIAKERRELRKEYRHDLASLPLL